MTSRSTKKSDNDFIFLKIIGEARILTSKILTGSFSTVYLCRDVETAKEYAIKACDKKLILREKKQEYIKREKDALLKLNNTIGVIQLLSTFQSDKYLFFVLTYAKNSELHHYLKLKIFNLECVKYYSAQLLIAIEGIHRKNIIHRDLKPQNLLLDSSMKLIVGDFGSSKILSDQTDSKEEQLNINNNNKNQEERNISAIGESKRRIDRRASFVGTALYVSPEVLKGSKSHFSTDLFAYGCIVYEMCAHGRPVFGSSGENEYVVFQKIQNMDYKFPENFDSEVKDLVQKLLKIDPEERLGAKDPKESIYKSIRDHEFFSTINFDTIYSQTSPLIFLNNFAEMLQQNNVVQPNVILEPGLGEKQLKRILQSELNLTSSNLTPEALEKLFKEQTKIQWSEFLDENEYLIKYGFIYKRKGLIPRKRMLLLSLALSTNTPRLSYIDANANIKKGEIPLDSTTVCEPKNFKTFFIHTPNRIYFLESHEGDALKWCEAIEKIRDKYCK
ncbi:hypothetical protein PVAND_006498 [Polypedilum vanderplanki]|uniref:3-phosphoinositide-dependent protein kinase 1 n=1 Tax=Polypedilum vanderplanki TaxID=319348 RepID=A0A9J6C3U4_POLVA|nr:hypothetical protein PVAND_006498 [Polypedilum vanderplanki]